MRSNRWSCTLTVHELGTRAGTTITVARSALFNAHASVADNYYVLRRAIQGAPAP